MVRDLQLLVSDQIPVNEFARCAAPVWGARASAPWERRHRKRLALTTEASDRQKPAHCSPELLARTLETEASLSCSRTKHSEVGTGVL